MKYDPFNQPLEPEIKDYVLLILFFSPRPFTIPTLFFFFTLQGRPRPTTLSSTISISGPCACSSFESMSSIVVEEPYGVPSNSDERSRISPTNSSSGRYTSESGGWFELPYMPVYARSCRCGFCFGPLPRPSHALRCSFLSLSRASFFRCYRALDCLAEQAEQAEPVGIDVLATWAARCACE